MTEEVKGTRTLTDSDVEAIVAATMKQIEAKLYTNLGKGLWGLFTKAFVGVVFAIAAVGYFKGLK